MQHGKRYSRTAVNNSTGGSLTIDFLGSKANEVVPIAMISKSSIEEDCG